MKQTWMGICAFLILIGSDNVPASAEGAQAGGTFEGTIAGKEYQVSVDCFNRDEPYFQFESVKTEGGDGNQTGITISGMQEGEDRLVLTVVDGEKILHSGTIADFEKENGKLSATGELQREGDEEPDSVDFTVTCP
ncbi:hypothetical protein Thimo_1534 [Thioflavicoccus mobilis 8321]|uniref:Uncharacterized protein n=1 Tax=Thioflavicoccus mobilis 8321 TaxID=765912 RepID=L0GWW1_9GAMM|nr:hypothetical protein [Thioflavicoccus mobilis]AGA90317.1 hypothetical protein Thimo_1534 [Thioflavicoccus mobilis 8321]